MPTLIILSKNSPSTLTYKLLDILKSLQKIIHCRTTQISVKQKIGPKISSNVDPLHIQKIV